MSCGAGSAGARVRNTDKKVDHKQSLGMTRTKALAIK